MPEDAGRELIRLLEVMARLRGEGGCPWDLEQDLRSLRPYLLEEAFEVLDEMDRVAYGGPWRPLCEELGDLLFQIVFHAQLATEKGEFGMADVCRAISDKIVSRHPHVFGDRQVSGSEQVLENWARLKADERRKKTGRAGSVLDGVPMGAPSLMRAERLTEKASRIGFDWPDLAGVRAKVDEELRELDEAIAANGRDELEHELGDVLFALANLARFIKTPPEDALRQANRRFETRFHAVESGLKAAGIPFGAATLEQMDALWELAKREEKLAPKPRDLPRPSVVRACFLVEDVDRQRRFWDLLAEALRWKPVRGRADEARYTDGALEISFARGDGAGGGLELEAPARPDVDAFAQALAKAGAASIDGPGEDSERRYSVRFRDPAGLAWVYGAP